MDKKNKSVTIFVIIMVVIFLFFGSWLCYSNKDKFLNLLENFIGEKIIIDDQEFQKIGYGPAIDATVMTIGQDGLSNAWSSKTNLIPYKNHEGLTIYLTGEEFRAINGFIPPSFEFFPFGINNSQPGYKTYKPEDDDFNIEDARFSSSNVEEGRELCFKACKDTGCIAVQTEVPQNCYDRRTTVPVPPGLEVIGNPDAKFMVSKNVCNNKATHGCTLFYNNVDDADDAYYTLAGGEEGYNDASVPLKIGEKYYEQNRLPDITPSSGLPSTSIVKFCPPNITEGDVVTRYKTISGSTADCTCTNETTCSDPNCCLYRNLLTTTYVKNNKPYYNLPINLTKTNEIETFQPTALCNAVVNNGDYFTDLPDVDNITTNLFTQNCCGYCEQTDGSFKLVSCPNTRQFVDNIYKDVNGSPRDSNIYWHIDTSICSQPPGGLPGALTVAADWIVGSTEANLTEDECKDNYLEALDSGSTQEEAYLELTKCCGFLDQACQTITVQPFCRGSDSVDRGCFSDPPILNVHSVTEGGSIKSADDPTVISNADRCVEDADGVICKAFPYGVSERSGSLWKPV